MKLLIKNVRSYFIIVPLALATATMVSSWRPNGSIEQHSCEKRHIAVRFGIRFPRTIFLHFRFCTKNFCLCFGNRIRFQLCGKAFGRNNFKSTFSLKRKNSYI